MKKIFFTMFLIFFITFFKQTSWNYITKDSLEENFKIWNILSTWYDSIEKCDEWKTKYNSSSPNYFRSSCFINENKYYYFICSTWDNCNISSSSTSTTPNSNSTSWTNWWKWKKVSSSWTYFSPTPPQCSSQVEWWNCNEWWYCIWSWYDLKCQYSWASSSLIKIENNYWNNTINNCSNPWSSLAFNIWNSQSDIKVCIEYNLTAQWKEWKTYNCDLDTKFYWLSSPWKFENWKWSYFTYLQNHKSFVPWKYRLVVKANDWANIYWEWLTINTSWNYSNPANCNYYAYPAKSVEDALWYLHNNANINITTWIDWKNIPVPSWCDITKDVVIKLITNSIGWASFSSQRVMSFTDLHKCFTRKPPTWSWLTYTWWFWTQVNWQANNDVLFDFQSWYNWWDSWTLVWPWCWNVPSHWLSQYYGWIKWENWKVFNCTAKTYWWVAILNNGISKPLNVSFSKTKLNETWDSFNISVSWLTYDNFQWCRAVVAHPTVPSAVDPYRCNNVGNFVTIKDAKTNWAYNNWLWQYTIKSDLYNMPSWTKIRSYYRNKDTSEIKSVEWEVIWWTTNTTGLPVCWDNWKTLWTFTCDSQNNQVQTISTCLPPYYSDPISWNWNKLNNTFTHITWYLCDWISREWYPATNANSSTIWVSRNSFWAPSWREDLLCKNLGYDPNKLNWAPCNSEWVICYSSMWYWSEYKCTKK